MNRFVELMETNPPRLVVAFRRGPDGSEQYQWGVAGAMPLANLIGAITAVQAELPLLEPGDVRRSCSESGVAILWDAATRTFDWYAHPDVPAGPTVGMLEIVKHALIGGQAAQRVASQRTALLGPDGTPFRG